LNYVIELHVITLLSNSAVWNFYLTSSKIGAQ